MIEDQLGPNGSQWPAPPVAPERSSRLRILAVEDEAVSCRLLHEYGRILGCDLTSVPSGTEGLELLKAHHYDMLFADLRVPDLSGIDLIKQAREVRPGLPIIVITANATEAARYAAFSAGANAFVTKPVRFDMFKEVFTRVVDSRRTQTDQTPTGAAP